jgi:pilus assembly protein CpaB
MRVVTIVSLGASAVLGLAALVVAKTVLPNPAAAQVPGVSAPVQGVAVVVASKDMKYGDKVDADHLRLTRLPPEAVPQGAFSSIAAVLAADRGGAPVVLTAITAREPILPSKLSGPGARPSVAAEIGDGMRAYTIKVSDVSGVGGHALPGDRVDVVMLRDMNPMGPVHSFVSEVVLQDVRVLAVDLNADLTSNKPATPSTATLEVSVAASQKLAVAADLGKLSLALRRTGSAEVTATAPVRTSAFASAAGAPSTFSYAPRPRSAGVSPAGSGGMLIIEGEGHGGGGRSRSSTALTTSSAAVQAAPVAVVG